MNIWYIKDSDIQPCVNLLVIPCEVVSIVIISWAHPRIWKRTITCLYFERYIAHTFLGDMRDLDLCRVKYQHECQRKHFRIWGCDFSKYIFIICLRLMTSSNDNISALLAPSAGNSPVTCEFSSQKPMTRSFDVFFDLGLNKRLNKHFRRWWFETPPCSLLSHCNDTCKKIF